MRAALVTGCASGIGRALTGALLQRGYAVLATDLHEAALGEAAARERWAASGLLLGCARLDVREAAHWQEALSRVPQGDLALLVNVAGYLRPGAVTDADAAQAALHLDVNARGVMLGTQAAASLMVPRRAGHIINIASMAALSPVPGLSWYCASKFAVRGYSLSVAAELRRHQVALTVVYPDAVQTPMLDLQVGYDEAALTFSAGRALSTGDVVRAIVDQALVRRPLELVLPAAFGRGLLARLAGLWPAAAMRVAPLLEREGLRQLARRRGEGGVSGAGGRPA